MIRTRVGVWARRLAFVLAAGGAVAPGKAPARPGRGEAGDEEKPRQVVVTGPRVTDVVVTQQYAGKVRARRHIEIRALVTGVLTEVPVREGQAVKKGDVLFQMSPALYKAKLDAERAEVQLAKVELNNARKLFE